MNTVIAHLKKDLVPLRGLLVTMAIILIAAVAIRAMSAAGLPIHIRGNLGGLLQVLILAALIVRVIHQDSLTDIDEFWRTRPISRHQLLLAKGCFLVPPILAALIVCRPWASASNGADGAKLLELSTFMVGLAAFATVTSGFSKMILLAIKVLLVTVLLTLVLGLTIGLLLLPWQHLSGKGMSFLSESGISPAGLSIAANLATFGGFLGVVVYQYLTLKTETSVRAIYGLCLAASVVSSVAANLPR